LSDKYTESQSGVKAVQIRLLWQIAPSSHPTGPTPGSQRECQWEGAAGTG